MTDSLPVDEDQLRGQYIETAIRDLANAPYALKLANTQDRRDWVRNLGLNDFVLFLTRFNARLRGIDPNIHKFDSENVRVTSQDRRNTLYTPPPIEVNSPLLHQTLHALHKLAENPALPNDAAMRRIGLTAAGAVNFLHGFHNGNGRLGRWTSYILDQGFDGSQKSRKYLAQAASANSQWSASPGHINDLIKKAIKQELIGEEENNPEIPSNIDDPTLTRDQEWQRRHADQFHAMDFEGIAFLSDEQRKALARAYNNREYAFLALFRTLSERGGIHEALLTPVTSVDGRKIATFFKPEESISALGQEGVADFLQKYHQLQIDHVEFFLKEMVSPQQSLSTEIPFHGDSQLDRTIFGAYLRQLEEGSQVLIDIRRDNTAAPTQTPLARVAVSARPALPGPRTNTMLPRLRRWLGPR